MNPKEWQKRFDKLHKTFPSRTEVHDFISNLLEDIAVACEGKKKMPYKIKSKGDNSFQVAVEEGIKSARVKGLNQGLDTAAKLIRSLKGDE